MTFRLKQIIYGTMSLVVLYGVFNGYWLKGLILLSVLVFGSYMVDIRQIRRYTALILNKLYICLDVKAYDQMVEDLKKALFFPPLRHQADVFFSLMKEVYNEDQDLSLWAHLNHWYVPNVWRAYSKVLLDDLNHYKWIHRIIRKYELAYLPVIISVKKIMKLPIESQKTSFLELRGEIENNLQFAWVNLWLSRLEIEPNKSAYYRRIALNIAADFFQLTDD